MSDRRFVWLVFLAAACGGRVESSDAPAPGGSPSANAGWEGTPLGPCLPGWEPHGCPTCAIGKQPDDYYCPYFAGGLCYETKADACNCVCPRDNDSWCMSGWEDQSTWTTGVWCD